MTEAGITYTNVWHRELAREIDRLSTERFHVAAVALMETAGRGVAEIVEQRLGPEHEGAPVLVLAGPGNNGGDALVAARYLFDAGFDVRVVLVARADDDGRSELCARQLAAVRALGVAVEAYAPGCLLDLQSPVVVDGVLGLGFKGPLESGSAIARALKEADGLGARLVIAVDLPSGLDCDSGEEQEVPLAADVTVTFGALKPAHALAPARDACGEVVSLGIGFPRAAEDAAEAVHKACFVLPQAKELIRISPWDELPRSAHKYDRGHVLVIGGSPGKAGAPILAGLAALRAGAGWVTLAMPDAAALTLTGEVPPELTFEHLFDGDELNAINLEAFLEERKVKAVVVGPGTMVNPISPEVLAVLRDFSQERDGFVLLDAAATHGMYEQLAHAPGDPGKWLLTPHPGEWRKLGAAFDFAPLCPAGLAKARGLALAMGVTLAYKNATPVVISGVEGTPGFVVTEGTLALARAGSGDVLAGVAGAHGAAGLPALVAALRSQVAVAWAAVIAGEGVGEHAVLATDVIASLGNILRMLDER